MRLVLIALLLIGATQDKKLEFVEHAGMKFVNPTVENLIILVNSNENELDEYLTSNDFKKTEDLKGVLKYRKYFKEKQSFQELLKFKEGGSISLWWTNDFRKNSLIDIEKELGDPYRVRTLTNVYRKYHYLKKGESEYKINTYENKDQGIEEVSVEKRKNN